MGHTKLTYSFEATNARMKKSNFFRCCYFEGQMRSMTPLSPMKSDNIHMNHEHIAHTSCSTLFASRHNRNRLLSSTNYKTILPSHSCLVFFSFSRRKSFCLLVSNAYFSIFQEFHVSFLSILRVTTCLVLHIGRFTNKECHSTFF